MHREVINVPNGMVADHANQNTLDNRKANIRPATPTQNAYNKRKPNRKSTSIYKGVSWSQSDKKWMSRIYIDGKNRYLGCYKTQIEAAKAYDHAAKKYHGEFAYLNFPDHGREQI